MDDLEFSLGVPKDGGWKAVSNAGCNDTYEEFASVLNWTERLISQIEDHFMESQPKIELLTLGLQVDVCGGIILPLFRGKVDLKNVKSSIVEPKHFGLEPSLFEGLNLFKTG